VLDIRKSSTGNNRVTITGDTRSLEDLAYQVQEALDERRSLSHGYVDKDLKFMNVWVKFEEGDGE